MYIPAMISCCLVRALYWWELFFLVCVLLSILYCWRIVLTFNLWVCILCIWPGTCQILLLLFLRFVINFLSNFLVTVSIETWKTFAFVERFHWFALIQIFAFSIILIDYLLVSKLIVTSIFLFQLVLSSQTWSP